MHTECYVYDRLRESSSLQKLWQKQDCGPEKATTGRQVITREASQVNKGLQGQSVGLNIEGELDVGTVIGSAKNHCTQTWHQNFLSSVARYQPLQPEYVLAPYLSAVKGFNSRKLISRFSCGCHGLRVDTGRLLPSAQQVPRAQRHFVFCASGSAEVEHHFVFDCPAYCAIRNKFTNIFWVSPFLDDVV